MRRPDNEYEYFVILKRSVGEAEDRSIALMVSVFLPF